MQRASVSNLLPIAMFLLVVSAAHAETYYVATTGSDSNPGTLSQPFKTIQKGLNTAQHGDTVLAANGTYTGVGNRNLDFFNKSITLRSEGGASACILDGDLSRSFYFQRGETAAAIVDGFTITGGIENYGGGMQIVNSSPTIRNCVFSDNRASIPGGGGGIALTNSNSLLQNCRFIGNRAVAGGGLYIDGGAPTVRDCVFSGNTAQADPTVGTDGRGGAICILSGSPKIINTLYSGNIARAVGRETSGLGGSLFVANASLTVTHSTFYANHADGSFGDENGGGALHVQTGVVTVANSILWADEGGAEIIGTASVTYCDVQGGHSGAGNLNAAPLFANAAGGDFHLQPGSPCLNTGTAAAPNLPAADVEGAPRVIGSAPDMGAYEFVPATTLFVDRATGSDSNPGTFRLPFQTVGRALAAASDPNAFYILYIRANNYGSDRPRITKPIRLLNWGNVGAARIGHP
jgi:hypothetical protein